jgi:hypothetical protein
MSEQRTKSMAYCEKIMKRHYNGALENAISRITREKDDLIGYSKDFPLITSGRIEGLEIAISILQRLRLE